MSPLDCFAISRQGPELDRNDDHVIIDSGDGIFIVADGMGGHAGGAVASRIAATTFRNELRGLTSSTRLDEALLRKAVAAANAAVRSASDENPALNGMGTTLTAALFDGNRGRLVHVGDSRAYQFTAGRLEQLTRDHTLVAELIARNHLSREAARRFPFKHILSRTIGTAETAEPDIFEFSLSGDGLLLLATDGLFHTLADEDLRVIVAALAGRGAEAVCRAMMEAALRSEPRDDLTVVVVIPAKDIQ